jgi:hypothetical protein
MRLEFDLGLNADKHFPHLLIFGVELLGQLPF